MLREDGEKKWKPFFVPAKPGDRGTAKVINHGRLPVQPSRQLFILDRKMLAALHYDEVTATVKALQELGLYRLPYETIDVRMLADDLIRAPEGEKEFGPDAQATFYGISIAPQAPYKLIINWLTNKHWWGEVIPESVLFVNRDGRKIKCDNDSLRDVLCNIVISLLATRNARKTTKIDKLAGLGIGRSKDRHEYTTTISLPREMEDHPDVPVHSGREVCPHLRRAHIRNQRYGPNFQFVRQVLIEAVFVNADKEWTNTRVAYNISLSGRFK